MRERASEEMSVNSQELKDEDRETRDERNNDTYDMKNIKNNAIRDASGTLGLSEFVEVGGFAMVDGTFNWSGLQR